MSHANGAVRFSDGTMAYFEYNGTSDICIPKLYKTYDEMAENWRKWEWIEPECEHEEEEIEMFTDYGDFYWVGTACRKCMMILSGRDPYNLENDDFYTNGVPVWAYNCLHYDIIEDVPYTIEIED